MTIRERVRRALNKSESSSDSISQTSSNTTSDTANTSQSSSLQLSKTASKLSKTFTFGSRDKEKEKDKKGSKRKPIHPSLKPLTAQNLRHQEMLSQFTMTFGTNNTSQLELPDFDGVSPCCTRAPSIDGAAIGPDEVA